MTKTRHWQGILLAGLLWATLPGALRAQMNMDPYFTAINYPLEKQSLMLMALQDFHRRGTEVISSRGCSCRTAVYLRSIVRMRGPTCDKQVHPSPATGGASDG